jgi:predicted RNA-binding protein with PIN domain
MPVIIDGHNLLWEVRDIDEYYHRMDEIQLCYILSRYFSRIEDSGEIIFDGTGPPDKNVFNSVSNIDVFFAGLDNDSDTVIEEKIKANSAPKRLTIVSSDRRLRRAASLRKAIAIKSNVFWADVQRQLSRKSISQEPGAKEHGLSDSETQKWIEYFGFGGKKA